MDIIDEARSKMMSGAAAGLLWPGFFAVCSLHLLSVFARAPIRLSDLPKAVRCDPGDFISLTIGLLVWIWACAVIFKYGFTIISKARANYGNIEQRAHDMSDEECRKMSACAKFGAIYCGSEWLFSPFGVLCRWEDIWGINAEFFYPKGRYQTHPYKWIVIRISLKNGEIIEGTVLGKEDILAVNDSFDGFIKYGEGKGIAISRKFV